MSSAAGLRSRQRRESSPASKPRVEKVDPDVPYYNERSVRRRRREIFGQYLKTSEPRALLALELLPPDRPAPSDSAVSFAPGGSNDLLGHAPMLPRWGEIEGIPFVVDDTSIAAARNSLVSVLVRHVHRRLHWTGSRAPMPLRVKLPTDWGTETPRFVFGPALANRRELVLETEEDITQVLGDGIMRKRFKRGCFAALVPPVVVSPPWVWFWFDLYKLDGRSREERPYQDPVRASSPRELCEAEQVCCPLRWMVQVGAQPLL